MLLDRAVIEVRSGKGGDGAISFHREKNVPKGGPDGGNGGKGGSIILVARKNVNTLLAYRHSRLLRANDGEKGDKCNRYGHNAEDLYFDVPVGTVIYLEESMQPLFDLNKDGMEAIVAKGGKGGRGNASFKSSRNRLPHIAQNGKPGEQKRLVLELKLLADAALIGFPSVGKSTLLNLVSKANVPTADYPFTTLEPNLGVISLPDGVSSFVLADMPGLIKGASEGKGLGIAFLRHIERCRVLVHIVSMDGQRDPYEDYLAINKELLTYRADLEKRPQIVVASMMDAEGAEERKKEFDRKIGFESLGISAYTEENVSLLMKKIYELVQKTPEFPLFEEGTFGGKKVYNAYVDLAEPPFKILHPSLHKFVITGKVVEDYYRSINLSTDAGIAHLISYLDNLGVEDELEKLGAKDGDLVSILDFEFEYSE